MTFVVAGSCHGCRHTGCVEVCPVDSFHGDAQMLYIHPGECIDCGVGVLPCAVEAIYPKRRCQSKSSSGSNSMPSRGRHFGASGAGRV